MNQNLQGLKPRPPKEKGVEPFPQWLKPDEGQAFNVGAKAPTP